METQILSYIMVAVGLAGFILAGNKVWWAWYVNLGCQVLWMIYALITSQYAFIISAVFYSVIFFRNAWKWTKEKDPVVEN